MEAQGPTIGGCGGAGRWLESLEDSRNWGIRPCRLQDWGAQGPVGCRTD